MSSGAASGLLETSLAQVRDIVAKGLSGRRARVWLFGSRATGDGRSGSDIDVAVLPLEELPVGMLASIRDALQESTIPWVVDLVDLSSVSVEFRSRVEKEGIEWNV